MADATGATSGAYDQQVTAGYRAPFAKRLNSGRVVAAFAVVAVVVVALFMFGRSAQAPLTAGVVSTTDTWLEGQPFGAFEIIQVPAEMTERFVSPNDLEGMVAATRIPAGALVAPQMLRARSVGSSVETQMRVAVDSHLWPDPGPVPGAVAVFAIEPGGCAVYLAELVDGQRDVVTLELDAPLARDIVGLAATTPLLVWEAPQAGWPGCDDSYPDR